MGEVIVEGADGTESQAWELSSEMTTPTIKTHEVALSSLLCGVSTPPPLDDQHEDEDEDEDDDDDDGAIDVNGGGGDDDDWRDGANGGGGSSLQSCMSAPPNHLIHKAGGFQGASDSANDSNRWLLVNIQSRSNFASHAFNRDVWRDELVENLIRENFIFWQQMDFTPEARTYTERYRVRDYPHLAIIDPRTGCLMWRKEGWTQENPMTPEIFIKHAMDFCSRDLSLQADKEEAKGELMDKQTSKREAEAVDNASENSFGSGTAAKAKEKAWISHYLVATALGLFAVAISATWLRLAERQRLMSLMPTADIRSFISAEKASNDLNNITELQIDGFKLYAQTACVLEVDTYERAKEALGLQLGNVPKDVREDVIKRALIRGVTQRSSVQDSEANLGKQGSAYSYMAFWSTRYNGDFGGEQYSTCVLVTGVNLDVAEVIAGYEETSQKVQIGSKPCDCGYLYCSTECPEYDLVKTRIPIFKRHSLSLKQQQDLHRWMVKQAVDSAEGLVGNSENSNSVLSSTGNTNRVGYLAWSKPSVQAFDARAG